VPEVATLPALPARRPEPRGEVRRAALLTALEELLRDRRLADVGVTEITRAAGVTRSAFYFYFPSKEAAVTELLRAVFDEMLEGARGWLDGGGDDETRVNLQAALAGTAMHWRAHRHLMLGMLDARDTDPAVRELWESWIELFVGPLAAIVEAERAQGRAPAGTEAALIVRLLLGMNERALERNVRADADEHETEVLVEALTMTWLATIYGVHA
jgi:AcrR family transcriptional regulator